jgi:hypothetical protein
MKPTQLKPTVHATSDTRKRIRENGPYFADITPQPVNGKHIKPGFTMFKSLQTDWWGWLPNGEYRVLDIA